MKRGSGEMRERERERESERENVLFVLSYWFSICSPLALKQLQSFLLTLSSHHPEIGDDVVLLLFKAQFSEIVEGYAHSTTPNDATIITSECGINLLLSLCTSDTTAGRKR